MDVLGGLAFWGALGFVVLVAVGAVAALVAIALALVRGSRRARDDGA